MHKGFARVYCHQCDHDYRLAYSCKTRYFCPSCHHKLSGQIGRKIRPRRLELHRAPPYTDSASGLSARLPFPGPRRRDR
ncbi:MAG: transposase zinc-binding domain-containing protein, partial [Proteobacteria bacterium]|nr:transposase zinc-binding domain-containing protein [Pseudomonadota bacterium]